VALLLLKGSHGFFRVHSFLSSVVGSVFSIKVTLSVMGGVGGNNCSKALLSSLDSSVLERKVSDVVLVDH